LGEISAALPKRQNRHGKLPTAGSFKTEVLAQAGITTQDASRAETVAAIEEGVFEQYTAKKKAQGQPVYVEKAIKDITGKPHIARNSGDTCHNSKADVLVQPLDEQKLKSWPRLTTSGNTRQKSKADVLADASKQAR